MYVWLNIGPKRKESMPKMKTMLLHAVILLSFVNFSGAAGLHVTRAASKNDLRTIRAVDLLAETAPSLDFLDIIADQEVEAAPLDPESCRLAPPALKSEKVIAPGRDLAPKVEDAARVKAILKLVSDIYNNVPLPYSQDGATFTNREGVLPKQPLGFYKEYTLLTGDAPHLVVIDGQTYQVAPDQSARGSERVIIGGGEKLYYTPDHYAHFIQLTVVK